MFCYICSSEEKVTQKTQDLKFNHRKTEFPNMELQMHVNIISLITDFQYLHFYGRLRSIKWP